MKKINIIIFIFTLLFVSCESFLEEEPASFLSPSTFFSSEENVEIALNGVYDVLGDRGLDGGLSFANYQQGLHSMGTVGTDQMLSSADAAGNRFHQMDLFAYTSTYYVSQNYMHTPKIDFHEK